MVTSNHLTMPATDMNLSKFPQSRPGLKMRPGRPPKSILPIDNNKIFLYCFKTFSLLNECWQVDFSKIKINWTTPWWARPSGRPRPMLFTWIHWDPCCSSCVRGIWIYSCGTYLLYVQHCLISIGKFSGNILYKLLQLLNRWSIDHEIFKLAISI